MYWVLVGLVLNVKGGRVKRWLVGALFVLTLAISVEIASTLAFRVVTGGWHFSSVPSSVFDPHPYLVGVPRPNARSSHGNVMIGHNSLGFRGKDFSLAKSPGVRRVLAIGGSSTYCTGVNNGETWPARLGDILGSGYEVVNFGVPGYSTVEHVIQTAFCVSHLDADVVLYYIGWNDLRSMHVEGLRPDYAYFHGRSQYGSLHLPKVWTGPNFASAIFFANLLQNMH